MRAFAGQEQEEKEKRAGNCKDKADQTSPKQQRQARNQREGQDYIVCTQASLGGIRGGEEEKRKKRGGREEEEAGRGRNAGNSAKKSTGADFSLRPRLLRRRQPPPLKNELCAFLFLLFGPSGLRL